MHTCPGLIKFLLSGNDKTKLVFIKIKQDLIDLVVTPNYIYRIMEYDLLTLPLDFFFLVFIVDVLVFVSASTISGQMIDSPIREQ